MPMVRRFLLQLRGLLEPRRRPEFWSLLAVFVVVSGLWAFAELADEIRGEPGHFDRAILLAMRTPGAPHAPIGPRWVEEVARDFTSFGGDGVLTFILLGAAGFLFLKRKYWTILLLFAATIGGGTLSTFLKLHYHRPRPDLVSPLAYTTSQSFPSGHALLAAATYLTLGALLARVQPNHALRVYLMFLAILLTFMVGVSRIYLGVHWPTDVLAGWTIGSVWALICSLVAYWLQRLGRMDREE
ncbi:phosphatase PAP2 family protein [Citrifermentans bremense]|uniref:phosphatase PAP2 family protein n=1 Tax=Citrifermentans bremense TaxID=60035 RepID=UPI0003F88CE5|nr:phosphatase PAP2 family protein [Citrifermentans bremense]